MRCVYFSCCPCSCCKDVPMDSTIESMPRVGSSAQPNVVPVSWARHAISFVDCATIACNARLVYLAIASTSCTEITNYIGISTPRHACIVRLIPSLAAVYTCSPSSTTLCIRHVRWSKFVGMGKKRNALPFKRDLFLSPLFFSFLTGIFPLSYLSWY